MAATSHLGRLDEALQLTSEALALFRRIELPSRTNVIVIQLGMVWRHRGELEEAQRLLEQGRLQAQATFGDDYIEAWARYELGNLLIDRGQMLQARSQLELALELRQNRGLRVFVAEAELALARLALEEGRPEDALAMAEQARSTYATQSIPDKEGLAHAMRARALLRLDARPRAREALAQARRLAEHSEDVFIAAEVALAGAQVAMVEGTSQEQAAAAQRLQVLHERASEGGLRSVELEARLALARLQGKAAAHAELAAIRGEAAWLGYLTLARRSEATH